MSFDGCSVCSSFSTVMQPRSLEAVCRFWVHSDRMQRGAGPEPATDSNDGPKMSGPWTSGWAKGVNTSSCVHKYWRIVSERLPLGRS